MSSTGATTITAAEAPKSAAPRTLNPKNDMTETWRTDKSKWSRHHYIMETLNIHPTDLNRKVPVFAKTDKMPYMPHWDGHKWILAHAIWPLVLHQLFVSTTGYRLHPFAVLAYYTLALIINAVHELHLLRHLGHKYGFLDGDKHARDQIPDWSVDAVAHSLTGTVIGRVGMTVFLAYSRDLAPSTISWWLPVEIGLYGIILDFWFYWYHRCMHDVDFLWKYHRTHHLTKHPNPLLSLFADTEQEIFDIIVIPFLTWCTMKLMGLPMGYYDWWMCHAYVINTELWGHSGLRVWVTPATTATPILKLFGAELTTEDHDLHHRKGWKKSHNYGKQTRLWDRLFGTCHERIEMADTNVDWNNAAEMPLFSTVK